MVSPGTIIGALALARSFAKDKQQDEELQETRQQLQQKASADEVPTGPSDAEMKSADRLGELVRMQRKSNPSAGSVDSYFGESFDLAAGDTVILEIEPRKGYDLRVARVEFDRRDNHDYEISVDGEALSTSHRAEFNPPRKVTKGGKVVAEVVNNSGSPSTVDFEFEGWGMPSEEAG